MTEKETRQQFKSFFPEESKITIGLVMSALSENNVTLDSANFGGEIIQFATAKKRKNEEYWDTGYFNWQLTKDGIELTDDQQKIETIQKLLKLLKA